MVTPSWGSREAAEAWRRGSPSRRSAVGPLFDAMLAEARIGPGMRVLDVGAGTGDQTLPVAGMVGPTGSVLAVDVSAAMLALLDEDARAAGLTNVETRAGDARALDLPPASFDAAVSANCLQFVPDPDEALRRIRPALKPGARLAALVGSAPERNPMLARAQVIVHRIAGLAPPDPTAPGFFALGAPGRLEAALRDAGFREAAVRPMPYQRHVASLAAMMDSIPGNPNIADLLALLDERGRAEALRAIEDAIAEFVGVHGVTLPNEMLLARASA